MRDLREDFKKLFDQYSHNVVYIRRDTRFRCDCYSERSGEARSDCPKCFGTSYVVLIEKQRTRRNIVSVPETNINVRRSTEFGILTPKAYTYYFEHHVNPSDGDLILEVEWDSNGLPVRILQKHLISVAEPKFGLNGRVEFWQVYCKYDQKGVKDDEALTKY
jgi:hypothetical protein